MKTDDEVVERAAHVSSLLTEVDGDRKLELVAIAECTGAPWRTRRSWAVGHASVRLNEGESEGSPLLVDLYVAPDWRDCGLGHRIVEEAIKWLRYARPDLPPLKVYCKPDSPARGLLERAGFMDTGERGMKGGDPEDQDYVWAELRREADGGAQD